MIYLPSVNEVYEGYVFTPVCQSFWSQGGVPEQVHPQAGTPPKRAGTSPLGRYTPSGQVHPPGAVHAGRSGQQAVGTHPTGMHSCLV